MIPARLMNPSEKLVIEKNRLISARLKPYLSARYGTMLEMPTIGIPRIVLDSIILNPERINFSGALPPRLTIIAARMTATSQPTRTGAAVGSPKKNIDNSI